MNPIAFKTDDHHLYATIAFNEELQCFQDTWFGPFESQENFRKVLLKMIVLFEKHNTSKILTDLSQMIGSFERSKEWVTSIVLPGLIQRGLKYQAVVVPKNSLVALAAPEVAMFEKRQFNDMADAQQWLMSV